MVFLFQKMSQNLTRKFSLAEVNPFENQKKRKTISSQECGKIYLLNEVYECDRSHEPEVRKKEINKKIPIGIPNFGNTCYVGSVLQSLNNIPNIKNSIIKLRDKLDESEICTVCF